MRGYIDFSQARPGDPHWWLRLRLVLQDIERESVAELAETAARQWLLAAIVDKRSAASHVQEANKRFRQYHILKLPWRPPLTEEAFADKMKSIWEQEFGSYDSPEIQEKVERTIREMERQMEAASGRGPTAETVAMAQRLR